MSTPESVKKHVSNLNVPDAKTSHQETDNALISRITGRIDDCIFNIKTAVTHEKVFSTSCVVNVPEFTQKLNDKGYKTSFNNKREFGGSEDVMTVSW